MITMERKPVFDWTIARHTFISMFKLKRIGSKTGTKCSMLCAVLITQMLLVSLLWMITIWWIPVKAQPVEPVPVYAAGASAERVNPVPTDKTSGTSIGGNELEKAPGRGDGSVAQSKVPAAVVPPAVKPPPVKPAFPIGGKFSRTVQKVTGINWLSGVVVSQVAKLVLRNKLGGKVHVKIKTYSFTDLLAGKIKSADVSLSHCQLKGVPIGDVRVTTANPVWISFLKTHGQKGLRSPVLMAVKAKLSQKDVCEALKSKKVTSSLRGLKLDLPGLGSQQLQIIKPKVELTDDLVKIEATLVTEGATEEAGVPITLRAKPKLVGNARIILTDLHVNSPEIIEPEKFAKFAEDLLNPIFDFAKLDRQDHAFRLVNMQIANGAAEGTGSLLLAPKPPRAQLAQQGNAVK